MVYFRVDAALLFGKCDYLSSHITAEPANGAVINPEAR